MLLVERKKCTVTINNGDAVGCCHIMDALKHLSYAPFRTAGVYGPRVPSYSYQDNLPPPPLKIFLHPGKVWVRVRLGLGWLE